LRQCPVADIFASHFTGTDGHNYQVKIGLGATGCPAGAVGVLVSGDVGLSGSGGLSMAWGSFILVGQGAGGAYATPSSEVQVNLKLTDPTGYSLAIFFTAAKIDKVTLTGNGATVDLARQ